jgi:outer membrane lipoprotein SlyB
MSSKLRRPWHAIALFAFVAPVAVAQHNSEGGANPSPATRGSVCNDCGVVQSIRYVEKQGETSGVGLVGGAVVGGVIGHQIGSGRGNTVATIAGAGLGAAAGNQIEKNQKKTGYWSVAVRMDSGATRSFQYSAQPTVREGERVKLVDGGKRLALIAN